MRGRQERWLHTGCDGKQPLSLRVTGRTSVFPGSGRYKQFNVSEDKRISSSFIYNKHGWSERHDFPTKSFRPLQYLTCWKTGDDDSVVLLLIGGPEIPDQAEEAGNIHIVTNTWIIICSVFLTVCFEHWLCWHFSLWHLNKHQIYRKLRKQLTK